MPNFHQTIIIGHLGADPEITHTPSGVTVAQFRVAVSEKWKDQQGQQQEKTEWYRCKAFRKTAELIGEHFGKGEPIMCVGNMSTREWKDRDGNRRWTTEMNVHKFEFIGGKRSGQRQQRDNSGDSFDYPPPAGTDDDIPF